MKRNYIGISCTFHDPALAIVDSRGEVVFAEASERYLQNKRAISYPADDVNRIGELINTYCEPDADLVVAATWSGSRIGYTLMHTAGELVSLLRRLFSRKQAGVPSGFARVHFSRGPIPLAIWALRTHTNTLLQSAENLHMRVRYGPTPRKVFRARFNHHLTHAAAACYSSPYREAVCAVIDGYGQWTSTAYYAYENGRIRKLKVKQRSGTSLGNLYSVVCVKCGFDMIKGEEWKVMGLAPYGKLNEEIYKTLESVQRVDGLRFVHGGAKHDWKLLSGLEKYERADLAFTGQKYYQDRLEEVLCNLAELGVSDNLVFSGGCALNSSANGRILERTPFESLYVFNAPGDDGNAMGAALLAFYEDNPDAQPSFEMRSPYLGSSIAQPKLDQIRNLGGFPNHSSWPGKIHRKAAELLAQGKIIGWVQGRAEFGPRALGNRSILADPRRAEVKDVLNDRVKFREEFRPFAPSILHEFGPEYFESYQESPYMDRTLRFREEAAERVPGVVHIDRTGRLQTVKREWNERYYDLIRAFYDITGVPIVLNTSFNVMGKPIVHSAEDAVAVFGTSGLDALVIEDELIEKQPGNR